MVQVVSTELLPVPSQPFTPLELTGVTSERQTEVVTPWHPNFSVANTSVMGGRAA